MRQHFFIYIVTKGEGLHLKINYSDLLYMQALGDYVKIYTKNDVYTVHATLKDMVQKLPQVLYRCHRSYAVSLNAIEVVNKYDIIIRNHEIPVGEDYKKELLDILYN